MIVHILKNGQVKESIEGYEVNRESVPTFYEILDRIQREKSHEEN
jgi:hypothetical protein